MNDPQEIVAVEGLGKRYGAVAALTDLQFAIREPQIVGILGPNGAGKTTLLDLLEGLARPTSGTVRLFGERIDPDHYPRRKVGVVLQREFVPDAITVEEYADLFASIQKVAGGCKKILAASQLADRARAPMSRLSGGEAQRLHLAAAVVHDPALLLLDEPGASLDPMARAALGAFIRDLAGRRTVLFTTHDLREAEALCDRVLFLVAGRIRADGSPAALAASLPATAGPRHGLEAAFFHHCAGRLTARGDLE
jgi:ABC-2 type transport system ATP-binding protein